MTETAKGQSLRGAGAQDDESPGGIWRDDSVPKLQGNMKQSGHRRPLHAFKKYSGGHHGQVICQLSDKNNTQTTLWT